MAQDAVLEARVSAFCVHSLFCLATTFVCEYLLILPHSTFFVAVRLFLELLVRYEIPGAKNPGHDRYRAITAYEPSGCLHPREAERVMRKLKTSMTREDFVAAVEKEDWDLQRLVDAAAAEKKAIADAVEAHRLRRLKLRKNKNATSETSESTSDPTTADASDPKAENSSGPALSVDKADAKVEPQSADHLALEVAARERRTVQWQRLHLSSGDIIERDTWGIDCYTRKNIELALGLVPAPLTMTRPQATFFIENVFLPAVNAVEDPTLAHDIQNTIKLLLDWYVAMPTLCTRGVVPAVKQIATAASRRVTKLFFL